MHSSASEGAFCSCFKNGNSQTLPGLGTSVLGGFFLFWFFFSKTEHQALLKSKRNGTTEQTLLPLVMNPVDRCSFLQAP